MFYRRADSVWWSVICGGGYTKVANFSGWLFLKNLTNLNCEVKLCIKKSIRPMDLCVAIELVIK